MSFSIFVHGVPLRLQIIVCASPSYKLFYTKDRRYRISIFQMAALIFSQKIAE